MDVVTHNGVDYKKATEVAKDFGYTTDYIGQLCRAKKVDARLVGRAWYVNVNSLKEHKKNRYKTDFLARVEEQDPLYALRQDASKGEVDTPKRRVAVEPVLKSKTLKLAKHYSQGSHTLPVNYAPDEEDLLPRVTRKSNHFEIPVQSTEQSAMNAQNEPESASVPKEEPKKTIRLRVPKRKQTKPTNLRAEERPEIVLKGDVTVAEATVERPEPEKTPVTSLAPDQGVTHENSIEKGESTDQVKNDEKSTSATRDKPKNNARLAIKSSDVGTKSRHIATSKDRKVSLDHGFTPASVRVQHGRKRAPTRRKHQPKLKERAPRTNWFAVTAIVLLVAFLGFVILTLRIDTMVTDGGSENSWSLDWSSWLQF